MKEALMWDPSFMGGLCSELTAFFCWLKKKRPEPPARESRSFLSMKIGNYE